MSNSSKPCASWRQQFGYSSLLLGGLSLTAIGGVAMAIMLTSGDGGSTAMASSLPAAAASEDPADESGEQNQISVESSGFTPVTTEVLLSRDPFDPVVPEDEPEPTGDSTDGSGDQTTDPGGTGEPGLNPDNTATTPTGDCHGTTEVVCSGRVINLLDVGTTLDGVATAVVQVDTTVYEVGVGERFAGAFEVRGIDGRCVTLLHGDDGFQLCRGDSVLK